MSASIILALDFDDKFAALALLDKCRPELCRIKIGKNMFTRFGPDFVKQVVNNGFEVFLDLKFHDIPNTVFDACRAAVDLGVWMVNVHAAGGKQMMERAREATQDACKLTAVTILTSMQQDALNWLSSSLSLEDLVLTLAKGAYDCDLDGVVASPHEANQIKTQTSQRFEIVSPGIRLSGADNHDQKRVMIPQAAIAEGVNHLVIGRGITKASDPYKTLLSIHTSLASSAGKQ